MQKIIKISSVATPVIITWVIISVMLFFIIREITLWYFRINENTKNISRIASSLEKIAATNKFIAMKTNQTRVEAKEEVKSEKVDIEDNK